MPVFTSVQKEVKKYKSKKNKLDNKFVVSILAIARRQEKSIIKSCEKTTKK